MTDLVEFLKARLDEDEQYARACPQSRWYVSGPPVGHYAHSATSDDLVGSTGPNSAAIIAKPTVRGGQSLRHAARHDPARVLAEVEAKRRRTEYLTGILSDHIHEDERVIAEHLLKLEALPYADHPEYRSEWRP